MPKILKEELRERLLKRGEEIGIPNFIDMIATEENGVTEDEVYAFLDESGPSRPDDGFHSWDNR